MGVKSPPRVQAQSQKTHPSNRLEDDVEPDNPAATEPPVTQPIDVTSLIQNAAASRGAEAQGDMVPDNESSVGRGEGVR